MAFKMNRPVFMENHTNKKNELKHPLYDKLPSWAKKTFDGLSERDKRFQIKNNKSESQILNSLGDIKQGRIQPQNEID